MKYIRLEENNDAIDIFKSVVDSALLQHQPHMRKALRKAIHDGDCIDDGYGGKIRRKYLPPSYAPCITIQYRRD